MGAAVTVNVVMTRVARTAALVVNSLCVLPGRGKVRKLSAMNYRQVNRINITPIQILYIS